MYEIELNRKNRNVLEEIVRNPDFLKKMRLGLKLCESLRIDFVELFGNGNIRAVGPAENLSAEEAAEAKYAMLNLNERQKILDYINNMLEN